MSESSALMLIEKKGEIAGDVASGDGVRIPLPAPRLAETTCVLPVVWVCGSVVDKL